MLDIPLYARPAQGAWQLFRAGTVKVPAFNPMPDVIVWGVRFFTRTPVGDYVEAFAYIVPPTPEAHATSQ